MDTTNALQKVARASKTRDRAVDAYAQALHEAHEAGASWAKIAKAAGQAQSVVFRFAQRHPRKS